MSTASLTSLSLRDRIKRAALALSREQADTLLLLGVVALVVVPHFAHLPIWAVSISVAVLLWRGYLCLRMYPLPNRWILLLLLVGCVAGTWLSFHTIAGRDAGVTLILMLIALKTLELRAKRDAMVIFFLGFFAVLTHFLFSQSLFTAAMMITAVLGLLTALVGAHMPVGRPPLKLRVKLAAKMLILGTPLAAALFIFFPRLSGPLWGMPESTRGRTGLSDTMSVGAIADLALDDSIAFHINFAPGTEPKPEQLYFRGPVLASFDGKQWTTLRTRFPASQQLSAELRPQGAALDYSITLEPQRNPWLFALDVPAAAPSIEGLNVQLTPSLQLFTNKPVVERVRYKATSYLQAQHGPQAMVLGLQDDIELPPGLNPKAHAYAAELRRDARYATADAATLSRVLLDHIRTEKFSYTLAPGVYGADSVDEFWFDRREGFCEHFAQAFVVIMRALDVPARIVTGYQGAEFNPFDGSYLVRQSHAHAWAEYWQPGAGWVRADPTAAVAPERVNTPNRTLAGQRGLFGVDALRGLSPTLLQQFRQGLDAVNNAWNQWVLSYNSQRQFDLMKTLGMKDPDWASVAVTMIGATLAGAAMIGLWFAWETWGWTKRRDPWARLWRKARVMLLREGIEIKEHQAPRSASAQVQGLKFAAQWHAWLLELEALRYAPALQSGSQNTPQSYAKLKQSLKALRP